MTDTQFFVPGIPVQQGSKRHVGNGVMVEMAKNLRPWRDSVTYAARAACRQDCDLQTGPLTATLTFWFPRPKSHYRANGLLKPNAPTYKSSAPDVDKLARAVLDAITGSGLWHDDAQVAGLQLTKRYANEPTGVGLAVTLGRMF